MEWWEKGSLSNPYKDKNFFKILDFYLFNCPVSIKGKKVSKRAKSFEEYKISNTDLTKLLKMMKKDLVDSNYRILKNDEDIEKTRLQLEKSSGLNDEYYEYVIFKENTEIGKTRTIYYSIRNALAHGSFSTKDIRRGRIYCFEASKDGKIKAQIRLKDKTLLKWIDLIIGYSENQKSKKSQKVSSKKISKAKLKT